MVLVTNEWQNTCEDVPKTTANTATTACISTTTAPTTSSSSATITAASFTGCSEQIPATGAESYTKTNQNTSEAVAEDLIKSITVKASLTSTGTALPESKTIIQNKPLANDSANNEQINKIIKDKSSVGIAYNSKISDYDDKRNECKVSEVGKVYSITKLQLKAEQNLEEFGLNYSNKKIMAEDNKESPLKEDKEEEGDGVQPQNLINNHHTGNNKDFDENIPYQNSNTSTLTAASITVKIPQNNQQQNIIIQQQQPLLNCPVTPHVLSSALQSTFNAANNANNANSSMSAAGLQSNFLSQLALTAKKSTATIATISSAQQLNQSFNTLDSSNQNKSDSNLLENTPLTSVPAVTYDSNGQAKIVLICEANSHPFQTRTISLTPNVECMVGRLIAKSKASENNAIFDCKVLSRKHAVIWYTPDGKFWVKDTKSSNGTFINDNKLGDEEAELHFGDIVKFGVDVLENSRKEVHGCIIACVKLYLPDGREAISIDSSAYRSQYSGEGRISYDELHRLNLYIQETSQREKVLTSKLCNIQNVLDATRKNSALCWQSMITEDQLLHRIHSLEKKLQFMEKNVPENILRNEVLKLLDDKNSYQHTAKEALRKVYQERCDAMQMLAKMESAYTQSDAECSLLRDQIMDSKQILQDVNTRLLRLESEYNEYKDEMAQQQREAKEREEQRITDLTEKLRERELECEDMKKKISELLTKRSKLLEDEDHSLEKQAIEKLDAALADMDLSDDDDSSDEDENDEVDVEKSSTQLVRNKNENEPKRVDVVINEDKEPEIAIKAKMPTTRPQLVSIFDGTFNDAEKEQRQDNPMLKNGKEVDTSDQKLPPKRVKETTIMKWLQNSDLNKNEGSFDIFKAICNENENDNYCSGEGINLSEQQLKDAKIIQIRDTLPVDESNLLTSFAIKMENIQKYLIKVETVIENQRKKEELQVNVKYESETDDSSDEDDSDDARDGACSKEQFIIQGNGEAGTQYDNKVLSNEDKKYFLLKSSVIMLREVYNELLDSIKNREKTHCKQHNEEDKLPPPNIKIQTLSQICNTSPNTGTTMKFENQNKLASSESDNTESDSEVESVTLSSPVSSSHNVTVVDFKTNATNTCHLQEQLKEYQFKVEALNKKLQQTELDAQNTLDIMEVECDDAKYKMDNLLKIIEALENDKRCMQQIITENENKAAPLETLPANLTVTTNACRKNDAQLERDLELEDPVLNAMNIVALEREEELITYKERLDEQQRENIHLRNKITFLEEQNAVSGRTKYLLLKQCVPFSVIVLAIIIYFFKTYY